MSHFTHTPFAQVDACTHVMHICASDTARLHHSKGLCFINPGSLKDTSAIVLRDILLNTSLFSPAFFTRKSSSNDSFVAFSYIYVHTCIYIHIYIYMYMYTYTCIPSCTFLHTVFTRQQRMRESLDLNAVA